MVHEMLANCEYYLAWLVWSNTKDAKTGANRPSRRPTPELVRKPSMTLDPEDGGPVHVIGAAQGMTREQMAAILGWEPPPAGAPE